MPNFYRKGDPTSSPFDPAMGDVVIYRDHKRSGAVRRFPAIITCTHANDRVDLTVFSDTGVRYVRDVGFHADENHPNSYGWMPAKQARVEQPVTIVKAS